MASKVRIKIKLVATDGSGHFYTMTKNPRNTPDKFEFKKYNPFTRKRVIYKEAKIK